MVRKEGQTRHDEKWVQLACMVACNNHVAHQSLDVFYTLDLKGAEDVHGEAQRSPGQMLQKTRHVYNCTTPPLSAYNLNIGIYSNNLNNL